MNAFKGFALSSVFHPYIKNLNTAIASGCLPLVGRESEIERVLETLLRQWKNNPLLIGKPGVGKTAIVTEVAARIQKGNVPPFLKGKIILEFALNAFVFSRESPERLLRDIEEFFLQLSRYQQRIILFLDELQIPSLRDTEGTPFLPHVANLLKSHLASRDLTVIATTTPDGYAQVIKTDETLSSCFEPLMIPEPGKPEMRRILVGIKRHFERYYKLSVPDPVLLKIPSLAQRFHASRAFPDKAIELLDVSCSKAAVRKKKQVGMDEVYESLSAMAKLPVSVIKKNPYRQFLSMQKFLESKLVNQKEAVDELCRVLKIFQLQRKPDADKPVAVLLFLGPAGIGKSLIAGRVAEHLFGSREKLRLINLSTLKKPQDYEKLVTPREDHQPGWLIRELDDHPFSIVLFENVGEAHENVLSFLSRTITRGEMLDSQGKKHDLTHVLFILSLTAIGEAHRESVIGFEKKSDQETAIVIPTKIMNMLDWVNEIIQFAPLTLEHLKEIARQEAQVVAEELARKYRCFLQIDMQVISAFAREAEKSGRFAHFVTEAVERQLRMRAMDLVSRGQGQVSFTVKLKGGKVVFAPVSEKQNAKSK